MEQVIAKIRTSAPIPYADVTHLELGIIEKTGLFFVFESPSSNGMIFFSEKPLSFHIDNDALNKGFTPETLKPHLSNKANDSYFNEDGELEGVTIDAIFQNIIKRSESINQIQLKGSYFKVGEAGEADRELSPIALYVNRNDTLKEPVLAKYIDACIAQLTDELYQASPNNTVLTNLTDDQLNIVERLFVNFLGESPEITVNSRHPQMESVEITTAHEYLKDSIGFYLNAATSAEDLGLETSAADLTLAKNMPVIKSLFANFLSGMPEISIDMEHPKMALTEITTPYDYVTKSLGTYLGDLDNLKSAIEDLDVNTAGPR